jgi:hypothetical protein
VGLPQHGQARRVSAEIDTRRLGIDIAQSALDIMR